MSSKILVLPGDGIGVEVADQTIRVIEKLNEQGLDANYEKDLVGGASYDVNGEPLTEAVFCLLYTSPSPRDLSTSRMPSSA